MHRRTFMLGAAGLAATAALPLAARPASAPKQRVRALAFDAFPIFDPRPIAALAKRLYPSQSDALMTLWRRRQFEYQWLRALGGNYRDFWLVTDDALAYAATELGLDLTAPQREALMQAYLELQPWPDVAPALTQLRDMGLRLCFLSNATPRILQSGVRNGGLENHFEHIFSTDAIKTYKPDPRAYQMAVEGLGLAKEEILFVAFAGWDVAGAKWFGYPCFWINRLGLPPEQLGAQADGEGRTLQPLVEFVRGRAVA